MISLPTQHGTFIMRVGTRMISGEFPDMGIVSEVEGFRVILSEIKAITERGLELSEKTN